MVDTHEAAPRSPKAQRKEQASALIGAGLYLLFYTAMVLFNAHPPKLPPVAWALLAPLTTVIYLLLLVHTLRLFCRLSLSARQETLLMLLMLLLFLILNPMVRDIAWKLLSGHSWQQIYSQLTISDIDTSSTIGILLSILVPFLLILTGAFFGQIIARLIRERAILVPVAIIAGLVDFWGVYWGPVGNWSANVPAAVSGLATAATQAAMVPLEVILPPQLAVFGNIAPPANIGIGDFVFLAFFLTCAYRLGLPARRIMWGIFAGLLLSSVLFALNGRELFHLRIAFDYLPGLVFISGGVLAAGIGSWKLSRSEWLMTGVLTAVFLAFIGHSMWVTTRNTPHMQIEQFAVNTMEPLDCFAQVRRRLAQNVKPDTELLPVDAAFYYQVDGTRGPRIIAWRLLIVERRPRTSLFQLRETQVLGFLDPKIHAWAIRIERQSPPATAITFLRKPGMESEKPLEVLQQAHGIPERAFGMLDARNVGRLLDDLPNRFIVHLQPDHGVIIGERDAVLKSLPYDKLK